MSSRSTFRTQRDFLVRSVLLHHLPIPPVPDVSAHSGFDVNSWRSWLLQVWSSEQIAIAVRHASPDLARQIDALAEQPNGVHKVRRLVLALLSYVLRMTHRTMPFGFFAGIAEGQLGAATDVHWGCDHRVLTRADGAWVTAVVQQLTAIPEVRRSLRVMANSSLRTRGQRLVLPWQPRSLKETGTTVREVGIRSTAPVRAIVELAATPVPYRQVVDELAASHPELGSRNAEDLLDLMIDRRMLVTSLQPTSTTIDALGYVARALEDVCLGPTHPAADLVTAVRDLHTRISSLNQQSPAPGRASEAERQRLAIVERMREIEAQSTPLAIDVQLDARFTLPRAVGWEAQAAADVLARITPEPHGTAAWIRYRAWFLNRYGENVAVPVMDLLDPHTGLGYPEDFHGTPRAPHPGTTRRDRLLVAVTQRVLAAGEELVLDDGLIEQLAPAQPATAADAPTHLELIASVHAATAREVDAGRFTLAVRRVSRGWGYFTGGRAAALLAEQDSPPSQLLKTLASRPTTVRDAHSSQLAFPSLRPQGLHITCTPRLGQPLISLSEYREADPDVLTPDDLAVILHRDRLHLVSLSRHQVLEPATSHPLQIECQTPTIARFLDELQRGQSSRLIGRIGHLYAFDWGAARHLPVRPRVRAGRSILSPATWSLAHADLPGSHATGDQWEEAFAWLRERWRLPPHVYLEHWDERLRLDLDHPTHRALLRAHCERPLPLGLGHLTLIEAEPPEAYGWCEGRPHEIITLLSSTAPPRPGPPLPGPPLLRRDHARMPGASPYLRAQLYCQQQTRYALLVDHLPELIATLPPGSIWWLTPRDDDDRPHTALTLRLPHATQAASAIAVLGQWARGLLLTGVINDLTLTPYRPHTGLWGTAGTLTAAEEVWAADNAVIAYQHTHRRTLPPPTVLAAASIVALATGFHHDATAGMRWLAAQPKPPATERIPKALAEQARTLTTPQDNWSALRATPAGHTLVNGPWTKRHQALEIYRRALNAAPHTDVDTALRSLVTAHLHLAGEPPLGTAWRLARNAALARLHPRGTSAT